MRPDGVVVTAPCLDQHPGLREAVEDLAIEQFVAKRPVEALVIAVLPWRARGDVERLHADLPEPGLDGGGDIELPALELANEPLCVVVGSEGKGLSRLVTENCDQIVSIPIDSAMESLNAAMAVGITLYDVSRRRATAE